MALSPQQWADTIRFAGSAYGVSPSFLSAVNKYEQSGTSDFVVNDWDSNAAAGTPSGGPFQFIKPTFEAYASKARKANPEAWRNVEFSWRNPTAQALAASWAFANGHGKAWATYQKALDAVGGKMKGSGGVAPRVLSQGLSGASDAAPDGRAAAISLIFGNDPVFQMAAARSSAASNVGSAPSSGSSAGGFKWTKGKEAGSYKDLIRLGKRFGLNVQGEFQTTGGKHSPGSYHYSGRAVDFGDATNSHEDLMRLAAYVRQHPQEFTEFYYNPAGFGVRNGQIIEGLKVPGHDDHAHGARTSKGLKKR